MHLTVTTEPAAQWSDTVTALRGTIYHSVEWADVAASDRARPLFFSWKDTAGDTRGVAVGIRRWSPLPVIGRGLRHLDFETYPALADPDGPELATALGDIVRFARAKGFMGVHIGSFMAPRSAPELGSMGLATHARTEFVIDLSRSDDELMSGFSSHHRRKVRKALKNDLGIREATTLDAMRAFRVLQVASRERRLERGENIGVMDDAFYEELARQYFRHELGRVFLATHDGEPVSAAFVSIYGGRALYVYGGSSDAGFAMDAPAFLFWRVFGRCRELGCHTFNLGGVPAAAAEKGHPSHGLYRFKAGFGGTEVPCLSGSSDALRPVLSWVRTAARLVRS